MELLQDTLSWVLLTAGGIFVLIGGIGALRMPNLYTRMHAASVTDTMGAILVLSGIMLQAGLSLATIKLVAILVFLLITSPTSSYALASAALIAGIRPEAGRASDQPADQAIRPESRK
ncbi:MAG: monovalent cation/H(+) antiporter subunit G [Gammaproteobacteria bacterium]